MPDQTDRRVSDDYVSRAIARHGSDVTISRDVLEDLRDARAELLRERAAREAAEARCDGWVSNYDKLADAFNGTAAELAAAQAALAQAERERNEAQRAKYGTPCRCEQWIDTCRAAETERDAARNEAGMLREHVKDLVHAAAGVIGQSGKKRQMFRAFGHIGKLEIAESAARVALTATEPDAARNEAGMLREVASRVVMHYPVGVNPFADEAVSDLGRALTESAASAWAAERDAMLIAERGRICAAIAKLDAGDIVGARESLFESPTAAWAAELRAKARTEAFNEAADWYRDHGRGRNSDEDGIRKLGVSPAPTGEPT